MNKILKRNSGDLPKRRWLNIGPGLILALAISAFIGAKYISSRSAIQQQSSTPPIVERQVVSSSYEEKSGPTPEIDFILNRSAKLRLSKPQLTRLTALQSKWQRFYGPKITKANKAAANTSEYLADAKANKRTPVAQIQSAAAPVIALSGEISSARRSYWQQATKFLSPSQLKALQRERQADWAAKKAALAKATQRVRG